MTKKKLSAGKVLLLLLLLLVIGALITAGICYFLASQDNIKDKYTLTDREENIEFTMLKGSAFGKEFEVSENMINTFINDKFCKEITGSSSGFDHLMLYLHEDAPTEVYAHAYYKGIPMALRCKAWFDTDSTTNSLNARVFDAYIGELKIPDSILNQILEKLLEKNEHVHYIKNSQYNVSITAEYKIDIPNTKGITIGLKDVTIKDSKADFRTNSLTGEALRASIEYISSKEGRETVKNIIDGIGNKIKDVFGKEE